MIAYVGQKSPYFTFRYDYEDEKMLDILAPWLKQNLKKYAIFKEVGDVTGKHHVQGIVIPFKSDSQFRRDLLKKFPNTFCRSNYSFVPVKKEGYELYICKQGTVWINNLWTDEQIKEKQKQYWENNKVMLPKAKSKKVLTWSQKLTLHLRQKYTDVSGNPMMWFYNDNCIEILLHETLYAMGNESRKIGGKNVKELVLGQLNALNNTVTNGLHDKIKHEEFSDLFGY